MVSMTKPLVCHFYDVLDPTLSLVLRNSLLATGSNTWNFQTSKDLITDVPHSRLFLKARLHQLECYFLNQSFRPFIDEYINHAGYRDKTVELYDGYINCHPSFHPGQWHVDMLEGVGFTVLYYPDMDVDYRDSGGTEVKGYGVEPYVPNSLVIFPAEIEHRALEHTVPGAYRFSVALKYVVWK